MRTKMTPKRKKAFLNHLTEGGSVAGACSAAGISRQTCYDWRGNSSREGVPGFREDWESAIEAGTDLLEEKARERALNGSDTLMIFLLKGRRPNKYRDNAKVEHTGGGGGAINFIIQKTR